MMGSFTTAHCLMLSSDVSSILCSAWTPEICLLKMTCDLCGHDAVCKQDGVIRNTWKWLLKRFKGGKGKRVLISHVWLNLLNLLFVHINISVGNLQHIVLLDVNIHRYECTNLISVFFYILQRILI